MFLYRPKVPLMTREQCEKIVRKCRALGVSIPNMDLWTEAQARTQMRALLQLERTREAAKPPPAVIGGR